MKDPGKIFSGANHPPKTWDSIVALKHQNQIYKHQLNKAQLI